MRQIDKILSDHPTTGVQKFVDNFRIQGYRVNHKRISRLMKVMGVECVYPRKCLSKGGVKKYIYPYLLRHFTPCHPNQAWSTDISYIPMRHGFMYLYAIIDVYSRFVVDWKLSNSLKDHDIRISMDGRGRCKDNTRRFKTFVFHILGINK